MEVRPRPWLVGLLLGAAMLTGCGSGSSGTPPGSPDGADCDALLAEMNTARGALQTASEFSEDPSSPGGASVTDEELEEIHRHSDAAAAATHGASEAGCS
jgi:hypothetical protein